MYVLWRELAFNSLPRHDLYLSIVNVVVAAAPA